MIHPIGQVGPIQPPSSSTDSDGPSLIEPAHKWIDELHYWLADHFFKGDLNWWAAKMIVVFGSLLIAAAVYFLCRWIIVALIKKVVSKTRTKWDDFLVERKLFARIAHLSPAAVLYLSAELYRPPFFDIPWIPEAIKRLAIGYMIGVGVLICHSIIDAASDIYGTLNMSRRSPISGFLQGAKLVIWLIAGILLVANLTGQNPWKLVAGIGALTAVLLLIFKDSILGLVASIQIVVNDLVRVGDWIEMPRYGVDGDVTGITLTTISVQNFDKTITTIPSHAIVAESFKNWRGMQESGARRIKRAICIDMNSVKFCDAQMIDRFEKFGFLTDYVTNKKSELQEYNQQRKFDTTHTVNQRRLTNIGTFRTYLKQYLDHHQEISKNLTFLVRHLSPTENGLPIEIYVFCDDTRWINYEEIQADIFDHILAVIPEFNLRIFQNPTGTDFANLAAVTASDPQTANQGSSL